MEIVGVEAAKPPAPKKKSKRAKKDHRTHGRDGESEDGNSSDGSSFFGVRGSGHDRISQALYIKWAGKHPGSIANDLLRDMDDTIGRDGEKRNRDDTIPACAKGYYLQMLSGKAAESGQKLRNGRELQTLCHALDHLAMGLIDECADLLAARLKAVNVASSQGNWDRACYLEMIPARPQTLISADEEHMVLLWAHGAQGFVVDVVCLCLCVCVCFFCVCVCVCVIVSCCLC